MDTFLFFLLGSVTIVLLWLVYLVLNNILDILSPGYKQEILGTIVSFALFMSIGVVLYYFGNALLIGWSVVIIALLIYSGIRKVMMPKKA